jgi:hypothetical protein
MFARIATFEGGDAERLRQLNEERIESGDLNPPAGVKRVMVLQGDRRLFVTLFESREELEAAEPQFDRMGDEIPEEIRGKRVGVDVYEVLFERDV